MNFYPFHIGDYAKHTKYFDPMTDITYRRMLDLYYVTERPLKHDPAEVAKDIGMPESVLAVSDILSRFFVNTKRGWVNGRCEEEIKKYISTAKTARKNGKLGAAKRWKNKQKNSQAIATLSPGHSNPIAPNPNPNPNPKNKEIDPKKDLQRKCVGNGVPKKILIPWPDDFVLTEEMAKYARDRGIVDPVEEFENFRLKAISKGYKYADWKLAWYAWVRSPYQAKVMGGGFI